MSLLRGYINLLWTAKGLNLKHGDCQKISKHTYIDIIHLKHNLESVTEVFILYKTITLYVWINMSKINITNIGE